MAHADWIIDLGPGAGHDGGRIVFEGTPADLVAARSTLTGEHLAAYVAPESRRVQFPGNRCHPLSDLLRLSLRRYVEVTTNVRSARLRLHPVVTGALLGLSWGIAMRIWMRFISTDPEFTWSGTGYILGATTLAGLLLGLGWARRAKAKGNWWRLTGLSMLPLGVAAGGVMIPSVVSRGARSWP